MSSLHSLLNNMVTAGNVYGWRFDALVLGVLLWALTVGRVQLRTSLA